MHPEDAVSADVAAVGVVIAGALALAGLVVMEMARNVPKRRSRTAKAAQREQVEQLARDQVDALKAIVADLDGAAVPPGLLRDRVRWLMRQLEQCRAHELALRDEIVAHLPAAAGMTLGSSVRCLADFYVVIRDETSKVVPTIVVAVESALGRVWGRGSRA